MYCFTPDSYIHCEKEDEMVLAISFLLLMLLSVGYFTILSIQRLNDLKLSKWLGVIVVQGAFSSLISMLSHGSVWDNIDDFVNMPLIYVLIFISAIFTVFLLLFRGVQSE
ncbi:putative membrane protein [Glaesserella parasuis 174]|nr:putative membrane protein [Glaesserella parasuis 174]